MVNINNDLLLLSEALNLICDKKLFYIDEYSSIDVLANLKYNIARFYETDIVSQDTDPFTGMEFVWVPGGCYWMGGGGANEVPMHKISLDGFWMGKYEVTQAQWEKVMGNNPSRFKGPNNPVERVSWHDVQEFIKKLNSKSTLSGYRLPTEAEWECAARSAGKQEQDDEGNYLPRVAWCRENSGGKTHPVGSKFPNAIGLYDMNGNVREWVADWFCDRDAVNPAGSNHSCESPQRNPKGPSFGISRVVRGCGWIDNALSCRATFRYSHTPDFCNTYLGFRVAISGIIRKR